MKNILVTGGAGYIGRHGDSMFLVANSDKFKKTFSWHPKFNNLKSILKTAYDWEKNLAIFFSKK